MYACTCIYKECILTSVMPLSSFWAGLWCLCCSYWFFRQAAISTNSTEKPASSSVLSCRWESSCPRLPRACKTTTLNFFLTTIQACGSDHVTSLCFCNFTSCSLSIWLTGCACWNAGTCADGEIGSSNCVWTLGSLTTTLFSLTA